MSPEVIKSALFYELREMLNGRIVAINRALRSAKKSRDTETKSTAGDKHETGRAMMQIEENKLKVSLSKALGLKAGLARVDISRKSDEIISGSLVETDHGNFFISIGLGKVNVGDKNYFAISLASPIGHLLQGKKVGEVVTYRDVVYTIKNIY